jgi:hypothetical protein
MLAELKSLDCSDFDLNLGPPDPARLDYWICAHIGPKGDKGAELFYFRILSPNCVFSESTNGIVLGRHTMLMELFDLRLIEAKLRTICDHASASTWDEVAKRLARDLRWEFEDYQPHRTG